MLIDILAYVIIITVLLVYLFYVFVREGREDEPMVFEDTRSKPVL